jgi:PEP-CTERM motif-containing protein
MKTTHGIIRVARAASFVIVLVLTAVRVEATPIETSSFDASSIGTWEFGGVLTYVGTIGLPPKFADYLSVGMPVTLDIFGDPNQPFRPDNSCSNPADQGYWPVGSRLQAGPFTWVGGDALELHDEQGTCMFGLNLIAKGMVNIAAPPTYPPLDPPGLQQLYVALGGNLPKPAAALGPQLDAIRSGEGNANSFYGNFQFRVTVVPEPATWILVATGTAAALRKRRRTGRDRQPPTA